MRRLAVALLVLASLAASATARAEDGPALDEKRILASIAPWAKTSFLSRDWRVIGTLGLVSVPHVVNVEALASYARPGNHRWDLFALGVELGYLPPGLVNYGGPPPKDADTLSIVHLGVQARWYPWRFAFVGANLGWQNWRDDGTNFGTSFRYVTYSTFVTPRIGVLYRWRNTRWVFGTDVGLTFRLSKFTNASPYDGDHAAGNLTNGFSIVAIPEITLVRVGFTL